MASEEVTEKVCPTLVQQLVERASNPVVSFSLGVIAASGGPELVDIVRAFFA